MPHVGPLLTYLLLTSQASRSPCGRKSPPYGSASRSSSRCASPPPRAGSSVGAAASGSGGRELVSREAHATRHGGLQAGRRIHIPCVLTWGLRSPRTRWFAPILPRPSRLVMVITHVTYWRGHLSLKPSFTFTRWPNFTRAGAAGSHSAASVQRRRRRTRCPTSTCPWTRSLTNRLSGEAVGQRPHGLTPAGRRAAGRLAL